MSMGSPPAVAAAAPFNAYGTMQNLLTSHMQKVSASQFDDSVEMRSPLKRQIGERWGEEHGSRSQEDLRLGYRERMEDQQQRGGSPEMDKGYR